MLRSMLLMLVGLTCVSCDGARPAPPVPPPPHAKTEPLVIWRLQSRDQVIVAHAGANGPTYSVSTIKGQLLFAQATLDEIALQDPDLHRFLSTMQANGIWALNRSEPLPTILP